MRSSRSALLAASAIALMFSGLTVALVFDVSAGADAVLVQVHSSRGSVPREVGAWMAVFADVGASLLVVGNGLRLLRK